MSVRRPGSAEVFRGDFLIGQVMRGVEPCQGGMATVVLVASSWKIDVGLAYPPRVQAEEITGNEDPVHARIEGALHLVSLTGQRKTGFGHYAHQGCGIPPWNP